MLVQVAVDRGGEDRHVRVGLLERRIPEGLPGAGGYREHDILVTGERGAETVTGFP